MIVAVSFGYIILTGFVLFRCIFKNEDNEILNLAYVYLTWCVYYCAYVILVIATGSSTTLEVVYFYIIFKSLLNF